MRSNYASATISTEKKKVALSTSPMKDRKRVVAQKILNSKLGAVLLGYKTRRIFGRNRHVDQLRSEFRDLIQFAYQLKQESVMYTEKLSNRRLRADKIETLQA